MRPGNVKTRLSPPLTREAAATLYAAFVEDTIALCRDLPNTELTLFLGGETDVPLPAAAGGLPLLRQADGDLGRRMETALSQLLAGGAAAILLGTDSPTLPGALVLEAFQALADHDVVLGPARDGGYYLVGLSRPAPGLFSDIPWSSPLVLEATLRAGADYGYRIRLLEAWYDVDTGEDLRFLVNHLGKDASLRGTAPATRKALEALGLT